MIFGIGLSKTGTTSLFAALATLGYRAATYRHFRRLGLDAWLRGDFDVDCLAGYDAATDLPLAVYYPQLDARYPGSLFILTVREVESWVESARRHFTNEPASVFGRDVRLAAYGIAGFDESRFRFVYERHVRDVSGYFRESKSSLLTLDVVGGEGWDKLCPFLGQEIPDVVFPHAMPGYRLPSEK